MFETSWTRRTNVLVTTKVFAVWCLLKFLGKCLCIAYLGFDEIPRKMIFILMLISLAP